MMMNIAVSKILIIMFILQLKWFPVVAMGANVCLLGCLAVGRGYVFSEPCRVTAGLVVHWKTPWKYQYKLATVIQNALNATLNPSINSNRPQCILWFIAIDRDCVEQATHQWKLFPLFEPGCSSRVLPFICTLSLLFTHRHNLGLCHPSVCFPLSFLSLFFSKCHHPFSLSVLSFSH